MDDADSAAGEDADGRDLAVALRHANERFRAAVAVVSDILWTNNADGEMTGEQAGWAAFTGQTQAEYQGLGWSAAVHPDDAQPTIEAWRQAVAERRTFAFEHRVRRRDGAWRLFVIRARPVPRRDGSIREWVGVHSDITERRAAELALQQANRALEAGIKQRTAELYERTRQLAESEARYRAYFDNFPEALFVIEAPPEGAARAIEHNPQAERLLGLDGEAIRGRAPSAYLPAPAGASAERNIAACLASGRPISYEETLATAAGERQFDTLLVPIRNPVDGARRVLGAVRDVTDRRRLQARVAYAHRLEAIGQMTGGVAHDFNNLLTIVMGVLEAIEVRTDDAATRRQTAVGLRAAEQGAQLTAQLLAFSRRQILHPREVDVNQLIRDAAILLAGAIGDAVELTLDLCPGPTLGWIDAAQFDAALLNLAVNARNAMEPNGGRLTIRTEAATLAADEVEPHGFVGAAEVRPGDYIRITAADTGPGFAPEHLTRVFEPFFTTKDVGRGSGLGLSQVYGFVEQSGGHIRADNAPAGGAVLSIYLPRSADGPPVLP